MHGCYVHFDEWAEAVEWLYVHFDERAEAVEWLYVHFDERAEAVEWWSEDSKLSSELDCLNLLLLPVMIKCMCLESLTF